MRYRVDSMSLREGVLVIEGWCISSKGGKIEYSVTDINGRPMKCTAVARDRADVASQFNAPRMSGFTVAVPFERDDDAYLVLNDGGVRRRVRINNRIVEKRNSVKARRAEKLWALVHLETLVVSFDFIRENGMKAFIKKAVHKIQKIDEDFDYPEWQMKTALKEEEVKAQETAWKGFKFEGGVPPLISIVIPAYNTPENYLCMLFDSIKAQTYPNFEVIVADGSDVGNDGNASNTSNKNETGNKIGTVSNVTQKYAESDSRFKLIYLNGNLGISGNTNAGLKAAAGDYIALCDHDDELPPWALYEVAKAISEHPGAKFIYTDEDKIDFDGKALFEPHFKSDFNMDLLTSVNYICHLSVIRRDLLEETGGFREEFDGAQDHDFFLRCLENACREEDSMLEAYYENAGEEENRETAPGTGEGGETEVSAGNKGLSPRILKLIKEGRFVSEAVIHIPVICYHWRCHRGSTASDPKSKLYAFEAGKRAVAAHYMRMGFPYKEIEKGVTYGYYHTVFETPKEHNYQEGSGPEALSLRGTAGNAGTGKGSPAPSMPEGKCGSAAFTSAPNLLVSVIIPNKDHVEDLDKCIRSVVGRSDYRNLEFIIVENNSEHAETFAYYKLVDNYEGPDRVDPHEKAVEKGLLNKEENLPECPLEPLPENSMAIRVVWWDGIFNYSAINNFGVGYAKGSLLLFLNNDIELRNPASITELVNLCMRRRTGIAGARLTYGDDTIQHAGVIVGLGGIAGAAFVGLHEKENSYMHRMMCLQDLSAVTAACLMMPGEVFKKAGGFREELAVAFNDIDLCMKVRALGKLVVYAPYASFYHYESKSRGLEDTPEKVERFNGEIAVFARCWGAILEHGDPYYNPNLTLRKANYALRDLTKEKPGEPYKLDLDIDKQLKTVLREKERRGLV